jgi:NitT/TauT family transport system substrate-binding protein
MGGRRWLSIGLAVVVLASCTAGGERPPTAEPPTAPPAAAGPQTAPRVQAVERVVIALGSITGVFAPHVLAEQKGFFREEGLAVELPVMRANLLAPAMLVGEVDYNGQVSPSVRNTLTGMPIRVVAATVDKSTRQIMARPRLQSMEELRGKTIAVPALGGGQHNSGLLALAHFGIDPQSEVTWLGVGTGSERFLAVEQGLAQAGIYSGSEVIQAEGFGMSTLLRLDEVAPLPESGIATTATKLETQPDQVRRALRGTVRALRYLKAEREGSLPVLMQFLSLTRDEAADAYDGVAFAFSADGTLSERSLRFTIESEKQQLGITPDVPFAQVADFGPLYDVLAEMGITPAADSAR